MLLGDLCKWKMTNVNTVLIITFEKVLKIFAAEIFHICYNILKEPSAAAQELDVRTKKIVYLTHIFHLF